MTAEVCIAAAGSGKTTKIVRQIADCDDRVAVITYTNNNEQAIRAKFAKLLYCVPERVTVRTLFSFLLSELIRPYRNYFVDQPIDSIVPVDGRSAPYAKKGSNQYYLSTAGGVYADKISEFAIHINALSGGKVVARLKECYSRIFVDEAQDLAGYDLELIELLIQSGLSVKLVGDVRQATYRTNNAAKNGKYFGEGALEKYREWVRKGICSLTGDNDCYRCNQTICDLADSLYPAMNRTTSKSGKHDGHQGVFLVSPGQLEGYLRCFNPTVLRYDRKTLFEGPNVLNFGASKGLEFDRVLILPNGPILSWLKSGDANTITSALTKSKLYVAITRAKHSVAFLHQGKCGHSNIQPYKES